jgi:hypothetical protein
MQLKTAAASLGSNILCDRVERQYEPPLLAATGVSNRSLHCERAVPGGFAPGTKSCNRGFGAMEAVVTRAKQKPRAVGTTSPKTDLRRSTGITIERIKT